ncbi:Sec34-like family-domain-containing protein [Paraphysoderma sedebokerense]|nr:Sec34-like family-domain-containing protein [Paraphysoderma sedebokerense]
MSSPRPSSLSQFESKAQLDDIHIQSYLDIQEAVVAVPIPEKFRVNSVAEKPKDVAFSDDSKLPLPSPLKTADSLLGPDLPPTPIEETKSNVLKPQNAISKSQTLGLSSQIETTQQFLQWFAEVEDEMEKSVEDVYRNHLGVLNGYYKRYSDYLGVIESTTQLLTNLNESYVEVQRSTKGMKEGCDRLLQQQTSLSALSDQLDTRLSYFTYLEEVVRILNAPGADESIVLKPEFKPMLEKIDESLRFMESNPKYKSSPTFSIRFKQCLTRCLTLIKNHVVISFNSLPSSPPSLSKEESTNKAKEKESVEEEFNAMFGWSFESLNSTANERQLREMMREIEKRVGREKDESGECMALLSECLSVYISHRNQIVMTRWNEWIQSLQMDKDAQFVDFARTSIRGFKWMFEKEYISFYRIFGKSERNDEMLVSHLESLYHPLLDGFRPRIIQESNICVLSAFVKEIFTASSLSTTLPTSSTNSSLVPPAISNDNRPPLNNNADGLTPSADHSNQQQTPEDTDMSDLLPELLESTLHDAQNKLIFRCTNFVQDMENAVKNNSGNGPTDWSNDVGRYVVGKGTSRRNSAALNVLPVLDNAAIDKSGSATATNLVSEKQMDDQNQVLKLMVDDRSIYVPVLKTKWSPVDSLLFSLKHLLILRSFLRTISAAPNQALSPHPTSPLSSMSLLNFTLSDRPRVIPKTNYNITLRFSLLNPIEVVEVKNNQEEEDLKEIVDGEVKIVCEEIVAEVGALCGEVVKGWLVRVGVGRGGGMCN